MVNFRILLSVFTFTILAYVSSGQSSFFSVGGAHLLSRANAGSTTQGISSIYGNPAGLMDLYSLALDVGYERRYGLEELSTISISTAKKYGQSVFGLSAGQFGSDLYSERKLGLSYARKLFSNLDIGATFSAMSYDLEKYGSTTFFVAEVGLQSQVSDKVRLGAYIFSPSTISLTEDQEVPTRMSIGLNYQASNKADVFIDISKTIDQSPEIKFGVDYHVVSQVYLRAAGNITQSSMHFGPAFLLQNKYMISGGYSYDNRLGHSSAISLTYQPIKPPLVIRFKE